MTTSGSRISVLIVGGGPVGLSLAVQLSRWGVDWILVERHPDVSEFPKGRTIGLRSMEILRQAGLEAQIQKAGLAPEETAHFYFGPSLTSRDDFELVSRARAAASVAYSPTASVVCSQEVLEALLRDEASSAASGESLVYFVCNEAVQGTFLAVDNHHRWLLNVVGDETLLRALDDDACVELVRSASGAPDVPIRLRDRKVWTASSQVADYYSRPGVPRR